MRQFETIRNANQKKICFLANILIHVLKFMENDFDQEKSSMVQIFLLH